MQIICHTTSGRKNRGEGLKLTYGVYKFPVRDFHLVASDEGICWAGFGADMTRAHDFFPAADFVEDAARTQDVAKDVEKSWFENFDRLSMPLALYGTPFQLSVWWRLAEIPCGTTTSYEQVAQDIKRPKAWRAVGTAVGANPVSLLIPCHRVINKSGHMDHYGWGADVKRDLLSYEGALNEAALAA